MHSVGGTAILMGEGGVHGVSGTAITMEEGGGVHSVSPLGDWYSHHHGGGTAP